MLHVAELACTPHGAGLASVTRVAGIVDVAVARDLELLLCLHCIPRDQMVVDVDGVF